MTSALITGTWTLISSSAELVAGARRMTLRIHRLLQPGLLELSEADRRRLVALQKRVDCLVHPLNYLLLWSKERDSCVQQAVLGAQDLLSDVCEFVDKYFPQDVGVAPSRVDGIDVELLEYYLRELEFACTSVSMAVNMVRTTGAAAAPTPRGGVSLSAVLRASRRIQDMAGRSGDLCAYPGRLYSRAVGGKGGADEAASWAPVLSLAALKVVAEVDGRARRRRYGLTVESRLPLGTSPSSDAGDGRGRGVSTAGTEPSDCSSRAASPSGLNASGQLRFPIEASLEARLATTAGLALPPESSCCDLAALGVDELALLWTARPPAGAATICDETGAEIVEAVLLPEALSDSTRPPLWDRRPSPSRLSPGDGAAGPVAGSRSGRKGPAAPAGTLFAFVFNSRTVHGAEPRGDSEMPLTPLDALYIARLCAYDDEQHKLLLPADCGGNTAEARLCPPHLSSSDEVLAALLEQADSTAPRLSTDAGTQPPRPASAA